ncbi:hypothetical protein F5880DRAFT_1474946 [Lentinula raphanica]|nr:hypothetical protein F5880DRAFT_1474946 [Lentinula raphanica]
MKGLFEFASNASFDTFRFESRIANTPAYSTILKILYGLSEEAAKTTIAACQASDYVIWATTDNTQNYHLRRMNRMGLENVMNLGMSCIAWRRRLRHASALDFEDKQRRRRECRRNEITVPKLLELFDHDHERKVFSYQWLWVLGEYVELLGHLKKHANILLATQGSKLKIPEGADSPFTLPTTSGSEQDLPAFLDSILSFMKDLGQMKDNHMHRMFPIGGDGLTFELYGRVMEQRQLHSGPFTSLRFLNPKLEWWHTEWTNDSRIIDKHLASYASQDPSTLGHSASKITRKIRVNQGKYDYNQGSELMYFVLDMRMLDCWRYRDIAVSADADIYQIVQSIYDSGQSIELVEWERLAETLNISYSSEGSIYRSSVGFFEPDSQLPPKGSIWQSPIPASTFPHSLSTAPSSEASTDAPPTESHSQKKKSKVPTPKPVPEADSVLARSQDFIREAMRSREMKWAVAGGDPGRVYEQMKRVMFSFAGSSHQKYAQYLLETIIDLELESSPELRETLLEISVVNLKGIPGHGQACDIVHEYYNRILEAIVQHKGREFGERFIREGIARHLHHFQQLKHDFLDCVDVERRSARHSTPNSSPEIRTLLAEYQRQELHSYRPGRGFDEQVVVQSHFNDGVEAMQNGSLKRWTTRMMLMSSNYMRSSLGESPPEEELMEDLDEVVDRGSTPLTEYCLEDGRLTASELDIENSAQSVIQVLEADTSDSEDELDSQDLATSYNSSR